MQISLATAKNGEAISDLRRGGGRPRWTSLEGNRRAEMMSHAGDRSAPCGSRRTSDHRPFSHRRQVHLLFGSPHHGARRRLRGHQGRASSAISEYRRNIGAMSRGRERRSPLPPPLWRRAARGSGAAGRARGALPPRGRRGGVVVRSAARGRARALRLLRMLRMGGSWAWSGRARGRCGACRSLPRCATLGDRASSAAVVGGHYLQLDRPAEVTAELLAFGQAVLDGPARAVPAR